MKDLVSVIVPIYKVEDYLEKCIESIISQTYKEIEVILVNDGSPDNCLKICNDYAKRDNRIIVVDKKNGGLSDARNAGISQSTGKYLVFIDSDDYIESNMIEELYNNIVDTQADISICNFYKTINGVDYKNKSIYNGSIDSDGKNIYNMLYNKHSIQTIISWNKIYKRELFNDCKYPVGLIHEDQYIICDILKKCKKISYITDKFLYHYVERNNSIMKTFNVKRFDIVAGLNKRIELFENMNYKDLVARTKLEKIQLLHYLLKECSEIAVSDENRTIIEKYKAEYLKTIKEIEYSKLKLVPLAKYVLVSKFPKIYDMLKRG